MKKGTTALIVVLIIAAAIIGVAIANKSNKTATPNPTPTPKATTTPNPTPSTNSNTSTNTQTSTNSVSIKDFAFSPSTITVKKGTKVTWTNNDSTAHTVTPDSDDDGPFTGSENLEKGESYTTSFPVTGTFAYHCALHPNMKGTVKVID